MYCERIFKGLNKLRVKYILVGGVAVNLHGYSRTTADLDIILSFKKTNIDRFIQLIGKLKMAPRLSVPVKDLADPEKRKEWFEKKNCFDFTVYNPKNEFESIDVLLDERIDFDALYKKRIRLKAGSVTISLIDINNLINMKKAVNRQRDKLDIQALKKIRAIKNDQKKN